MHYVLFYEYVPDYLERRGALRDAHLKRIAGAMERGELFIGGAFADPADGAMIVFTADTPAVAEEFARADPYVREDRARYVADESQSLAPIGTMRCAYGVPFHIT